MNFSFFNNIKPLVNKKNTSFLLMGLVAVSLMQDSTYEKKTVSFAIKREKMPTVELAGLSPLINDKNKDRLHKIANFNLPQDIAQNNVAKYIARVQLEKREYFLALASHAEGYKGKIYKDNEGWAVGNGWNLTKQSPEYNKGLAQAVFKDRKTVDTLTHMSGKSSKPITAKQMTSVEISPQQALQVTYLMGQELRKNYVIPGISQVIQNTHKIEKESADKMAQLAFSKLKPHEQEALVYHAYKCGGYSFVKFSNLITKIVDYSLNRKPVSKQSIVAEFNYSYKINGKKYFDTNAQEIVSAMFLGPTTFAQVVNIRYDSKATNIIDNKPDIQTLRAKVSNSKKLNGKKNKPNLSRTLQKKRVVT